MNIQDEFENFEAGMEGHETALHIFEAGAKAMLEHVRGKQEPVPNAAWCNRLQAVVLCSERDANRFSGRLYRTPQAAEAQPTKLAAEINEPFHPVMQYKVEIARLTEYLNRANAQAEHFEREWYLRGDQIDALKAVNAQLLKVLNTIAKWESHTIDFAISNGSNGVRDFYRGLATAAIAAAEAAKGVE